MRPQFLPMAMLAAALTLGAATKQPVAAQGSHTIFIPGLGADSTWWTRQNTLSRLQAQVVIPGPILPYSPSDSGVSLASIAYQSLYVRSVMASYSGTHYLIGHSLGGVVARDAMRLYPGHTAGILTVASPNRGAPVADNATVLHSYIISVINAASHATRWFAMYLFGFLGYFVNDVLTDKIKVMLDSNLPLGADAILDARTNASPIVTNRDNLDALPHGAVYGTIDQRWAWMKVAASAKYGTSAQAGSWTVTYGKVLNLFKNCQSMRRFLVLNNYMAKDCGAAYNALASFDNGWQKYAAGGATVAFDGFIPNSSSAYPGTTLADQTTNLQVRGSDHNSILADLNGVSAMSSQMANALQMRRR